MPKPLSDLPSPGLTPIDHSITYAILDEILSTLAVRSLRQAASLIIFISFIIEMGPLTEPETHQMGKLAGQPTSFMDLPVSMSLPTTRITGILGFHMGANLRLPACVAHTWPIKPSL